MGIQTTAIKFLAKWTTKIVFASNVNGVWTYQVSERFVPVNEVAKPYMLNHLSDSTAVKVLHGSTAVDLLPAYVGTNLDLSELAIDSGSFVKHFFMTAAEKAAGALTTSSVNAGDALLILVPTE